jgi:hypothetical protein
MLAEILAEKRTLLNIGLSFFGASDTGSSRFRE